VEPYTDEGADEFQELREKDQLVLQSIQTGNDDTHKITSQTVLNKDEVNHCFTKLEKLGLIEVESQEGMVKRIIDGQKRVF